MFKENKLSKNIFRVPIFTTLKFRIGKGDVCSESGEDNVLIESGSVSKAVNAVRQRRVTLKERIAGFTNPRRIRVDYRLDRGKKVKKVIGCFFRNRNFDGEYTCGSPLYSIESHPDKYNLGKNRQGEYGMCCINDSEPKQNFPCPYNSRFLRETLTVVTEEELP